MVEEIAKISINKVSDSRLPNVDWDNLPFGKVFSDHMFTMDYFDGQWQNPEIVPYGDISMSPATSVLHYGQSCFEGMKAHKDNEGNVLLFRVNDNIKRLNISATRMCMPEVPEDVFLEALKSLLNLDRGWVPSMDGYSLYIRPFLIATDPYVGIRPSVTYKFMIFTCPVGAYYSSAVPVKIETEYSRAVRGGTGYAKAAGNYAAALYPAKLGQDQGFTQLIWTDAKEHKYIEESGTMNIIFKIDGKLLSPMSGDTILDGITKRSVLDIARSWGMQVEERKITVQEIITAFENGSMEEAFGAGTAATIAPINRIHFNGQDYLLPNAGENDFSLKILNHLNNYKKGVVADEFGWINSI
ncbi:MAG: branched chain amino acid aminotransferase [Crocinitomicaceae bacterium]|nr:branched chain amino acid aminotransferase [Crocinitomicaceae bacterium]